MSDTDDQIAKLEALLSRVRSRSLAAHPVPERGRALPDVVEAQVASPVPAAAPSPSAPAFPSASPAPPPPSPVPAPPPSSTPPRKRHTSRPEVPVGLFAMQPQDRYTTTTIEPPPRAPASVSPASATRDSEAPLDGGWFLEPPPMEVVELEVDPDPSISPPGPAVSETPLDEASGGVSAAVPEPLESRSRLVIAPSAFPDGVEFPDDVPQPAVSSREVEEPFPLATSDPTIKAAAEAPRGEPEAEIEEEEGAPSSSRRPISLEEKMSEPDDAPTHTPPPASGRIPAASPLDLALQADSGEVDLVVVETKTPVSLVRPEPRDADVALFVRPAQAPTEGRAKTFGELLDEALSL